MGARNFKNRADWVSVIVEVAERKLSENPQSRLRRATNQNISGGHDYWGKSAHDVYTHPETLEEGLLALEMRAVLEVATQNELCFLRNLIDSDDFTLDLFGFPMDFCGLMNDLEKLSIRNPLLAVRVKILASEITKQAAGLPLTDFATKHCLVSGVTGEAWCADI